MARLLPRHQEPTPLDGIRNEVRLPADLKNRLPQKWERLGDVVLLRLPPSLRPYREELGRAFGVVLGARAVLADAGGISGPLREPRVETIWGESTETIHVENGVRFRLDARRIMFSSGNLRERVRMSTKPKAGETVVDLFAGIGYFSLPMAVHSRAARIVACELNPVAFGYLLENVRLNHARTVEARFGDCRDTAPRASADRVIIGYLDAAAYLPLAVEVLRPSGGWLHYHEACPDEHSGRPRQRVADAARAAGFRISTSRSFRLKSYASRVGHYVVDAHLER